MYIYIYMILLESYPYYLLDMINQACLELTSTGDHLIHHPAPYKESHSSPPPPPSPSLSLIPSFRLSLPWRFHDGSSSPIVSHHEGRQLYFPVSRSELVWIMCECSVMSVVHEGCLLYLLLLLLQVPSGDKNHGQKSSSILEIMGFWNRFMWP